MGEPSACDGSSAIRHALPPPFPPPLAGEGVPWASVGTRPRMGSRAELQTLHPDEAVGIGLEALELVGEGVEPLDMVEVEDRQILRHLLLGQGVMLLALGLVADAGEFQLLVDRGVAIVAV